MGWVADTFGPRWSLGLGAASGIIAAGIAARTGTPHPRGAARLGRERRWPIALRYGGRGADARELATAEIAVVEHETQR